MLQELVTPLIFSVFTVGFAMVWVKNRHISAAGFWALAFASAGMGFLVEIAVPKTSDFVPLRIIGDVGYLGAGPLLILGLASRFRIALKRPVLASLFTVAFGATLWFWLIDDNIRIRTEIISYSSALMLLFGAYSIRSNVRSLLDKALWWLMVLSGVQYIAYPVLILHIFGEKLNEQSFNSSVFLDILSFAAAFFSLSLAVVLFLGLGSHLIQEIKEESETDPLTGLNNRRAFEAKALELLQNPLKGADPFVLIVCDLDHFKAVNDKFGHAAGDRVLKGMARVMEEAASQVGIAGRIGGEEFVLLIANACEDAGVAIAEAARLRIRNFRFREIDHTHSISASIGLAFVQPGESYEGAFARADMALYAAKQNGRNRVEIAQASGRQTKNAANSQAAA